ncbi:MULTISPECIES: efflux RND transporter permease subunit [Methylococcus]|jgi:HAE1 family hydrophobic/amphiphilic exporter-1|uniref:efflux RND transporter permease subunit n=1 Tax=Methylococcus TaxID=413 RepID=UPI001C52E77B|nr:multidrug efflux RND transporter permease subunit [Methylococcus capsulatus]QXP90716.1 multidrug efflux RND transporter permease subunit [Methylococcus capsulatus]
MISKFFIERPIFANVIAIVTIILGAVSLINLPVAQYPDIVPPTIQVTTRYPGASAEIIANTVGIPIEQAVNGVENSLYLSSTSGSDGSYTLTVTFRVGSDLNTGLALVQNMVNGALAQLPDAVQKQGVTVKKVSTDMLQVISLYSDDDRFDETYLSNYAVINLQYPLARIHGVGQIKVVGAGSYSMRVWLNPERLRYYGLTAKDVADAIQQQNVEVVAGQLGGPPVPEDQPYQFTINALGRLSDVSEFENIIIKTSRGKPQQSVTNEDAARIVRVKDLARVELSQQTYTNYAEVNGHKSTQIVVYTLPGANAIDVGERIKQSMEEMSQDFPQGLKYAIFYDTTKFIDQSIHAVYETLFEAGVLVLIVIMVFLQNWRATLVPATTVPVTIIGAFAAMAMLGFSVNLMTLFALILAIGIVVDDAIMIVENAWHYIEKGLTPKEASIKAMSEMTGPVIGITLVLTAVFLPSAFLPGITGQMFRQFALVIASTAIISAINALTLKPAQCALYLKARPADHRPNAFYRGFNEVYAAIEAAYTRVVRWMVKRAGTMAAVFFAFIAMGGWLFSIHPTGFLPSEDQGYAIIMTRLPDGAAQPRLREASRKLDEVLKKTPGVHAWVVIGGLSILDTANLSNASTTFVIYDDWDKRGEALDQRHILGSLKKRLDAIPEAQFAIMIPPPIRGLGQAGGFQMMVEDRRSLGLPELQKGVQELTRAGSTQSGLGFVGSTFSNRSPQLYLDIDRTKAQSQEVPLSNVFATLQAYLGSAYVNLFNKFNQSFQVYVQADAPYRLRPEDIQNLYVKNVREEMVPLGSLLTVKHMLGSELVTRYNLYPAAPVFGSAAPGSSSGEAIQLMERIAKNTLPQGMSFEWTATAFQEKQLGNQAYYIYLLSIVLVFLVLAAQYESWASPAAVILVVPMALVGVIVALIIRHFDNNLYTQVGLVLMIALASKNAILVVEFARELRAEGMAIADAAVEATRRRFRPIIMTSFAFILGVVPLMKAGGAGAASQQAIGTVVFGGMLASTILAIPFVPVFYVITQRWSERNKGGKPESPATG